MRKIIIMMMAVAVVALMSSCIKFEVNSDGSEKESIVKERYKVQVVEEFSSIAIANNIDVDYSQHDTCAVAVYADEETFKNIVVYVEDGTLRIDKKKGTSIDGKEVTVHVQSKELVKVGIAGSGDFESKTPVKSKSLELAIAGAGEMEINGLECEKISAAIAGSGSYEIKDLVAKDAEMTIAGSGEIDVDSKDCDYMLCSIAGSGMIDVKGKVNKRDSKINGSGEIKFDDK